MNFKEWLIEDADFVTALGDEFNIRPEDLKNIIFANFNLNDKDYDLADIDVEVVKNGALITIKTAQKVVKNGRKLSKPDEGKHFIDKETLTKMLMQGYEQAGAPGVV